MRREKAHAAVSKLVSGELKLPAPQGRAAKDSHFVRLAAWLALAHIAPVPWIERVYREAPRPVAVAGGVATVRVLAKAGGRVGARRVPVRVTRLGTSDKATVVGATAVREATIIGRGCGSQQPDRQVACGGGRRWGFAHDLSVAPKVRPYMRRAKSATCVGEVAEVQPVESDARRARQRKLLPVERDAQLRRAVVRHGRQPAQDRATDAETAVEGRRHALPVKGARVVAAAPQAVAGHVDARTSQNRTRGGAGGGDVGLFVNGERQHLARELLAVERNAENSTPVGPAIEWHTCWQSTIDCGLVLHKWSRVQPLAIHYQLGGDDERLAKFAAIVGPV
eukprot:scaffold26940_cov117-Phaeocystis_antarctica.AAC.17